jgi:hypothetical protein
MPSTSEAQHRAMEAAAHGHSTLGIPESVGKEFVAADESDHEPKHELDIAKAIRAGEISSPQQYENIWLFDVRVTGTGTSYRSSLDEYVYRPPEDFLTDEFVERCNGLPLIFEHPEKSILTTDEYRNRAIGTVILPYIKGDEVWGIAKVLDADAAELMKTTHASTSPAVVFRDAGTADAVEIDGKTVLIEGKPSYLDHLAICENGVWDKGGEPSGISNNQQEQIMDENETVPAWADALIKRMDAIENKGGDKFGEEKQDAELKADEDKKEEEVRKDEDSEKEKEAIEAAEKAGEKEKEEEKAKEYADAAKANAEMRAQIAALQSQITSVTKPLSHADRDALSAAQARGDFVAQMFGDSVNAPLYGESPIAYRKRLAEKFKIHSPEFKVAKLDSLEGSSFDLVESKIYADAQAAALEPATANAGRLIPIVRRDSAGREITTYTGDMDAWMNNFKSTGATVKFNRQAKGI